jgi:hypothetical protein
VPGAEPGGLASCHARAKQARKGGAGPRQKKALQRAYAALMAIAQASVTQARQVRQVLGRLCDARTQRLVPSSVSVLPLVQQAIGPAVRRVLYNESLPAQEEGVRPSICSTGFT